MTKPLPLIFSLNEIKNAIRDIRDNTPPFTEFTKEQIHILNQFFVWQLPEKFFINDDELEIRSGIVRIHNGKKTMQLKFSNGYTWLVNFDI